MIIAVASGKGGTGKTFVALHLAAAFGDTGMGGTESGPVCLLDCDVEAPNTGLFFKPKEPSSEAASVPVVRIDEDLCTGCGKCVEVCAYHALARVGDKAIVFPQLCHGCGGCIEVCPEGAVTEVEREIGVVSWKCSSPGESKAPEGNIADWAEGRLTVGEGLAPPLIRKVRKFGLKEGGPERTVIIDSPPGTSCPMVTAVRGADYCVLVTEDTPFGLNDLELSVEVLENLSVPSGIVINKYFDGKAGIEEYARSAEVPVLMKIPYGEEIASAYSRGELLPQDSPLRAEFRKLIKSING